MKSLNDIFSKQKAIKKVASRQKDQYIIELNWNEIFGQMASQLYDPCLYAKTLSICTNNPSWAQEIQFYKKEFLKKINTLIKKPIENIYVTYKRKPIQSNSDQTEDNPQAKRTLLEKIQEKERIKALSKDHKSGFQN